VNNWNITLTGLQAVRGYWAILYPLVFNILVVTIMVDIVISFFLDLFAVDIPDGDEDGQGSELSGSYASLISDGAAIGNERSFQEWKIVMDKRKHVMRKSEWWNKNQPTEMKRDRETSK
jgi:hypothetical protein